jgi:protein TonB
MKIVKLIPVLLIVATQLFAQDTTRISEPFPIPDVPAEFPGGLKEFSKFLEKEIRYPKDAAKARVNGKVFIQFVVTKDGFVDHESINIIKGLHKSCDEEAIRLVKLLPKWKPATKDGEPVKCKFVLPMTFN